MRARYVLSALVVAVATGVFCVGVLSRLAMSLLARQNPQAHGRISDDGFEMGVVTLDGSVNLAVVGVAVGIVGWLTYLVARPLLVGSAWFQWFSISVPPGVVAGSLVVHPTGVDFILLEPLWLAIGLFVAVLAVPPADACRDAPRGWYAAGSGLVGRAPAAAWVLRGVFAGVGHHRAGLALAGRPGADLRAWAPRARVTPWTHRWTSVPSPSTS